MNFEVKNGNNFHISLTEECIEKDVILLHIHADAKGEPEKLRFAVRWEVPDIGAHTTWSAGNHKDKGVVSNWGKFEPSCAVSLAPIYAAVSYDDKNCQTIACSDGKNKLEMRIGAIEENARLDCSVKFSIDYAAASYDADLRIDFRNMPFYEVVDDVRKWWESYDGYTPVDVPEEAYLPVYSTWYSFHQNIDVDAIVEECRVFEKLGCKTVIVDDGWQCDNMLRGYAYCGDWEVVPTKVPDMKAFVDAVHQTGMKFVLWYSVPYIGEFSQAFIDFNDKMLYRDGPEGGRFYVIDPRYPETRQFLIDLYCNAVRDWDVDGFKLDFVDHFKPSDLVKEGMDYVSVYDAVDRLLKDVIKSLKEIKPEIMIEFRQTYMGPLMRAYGNMLRAVDCPNDSWTNQQNTLTLRMTSGNTAVHSDMVMWNYEESAECAAFQLTRVLFAVPQISVRSSMMNESQSQMVKHYLAFWMKYRETLLHGKMLYKGYASNYPYVSARSNKTQVGAVYSGRIAYIEKATKEIVLVNSSLDDHILIDAIDTDVMGNYECRVYDCYGKEVYCKEIQLQELTKIADVPVNGTVFLTVK